jgi:hypothetical protein
MKRLLVFTLTSVWLAACEAPSAPAAPETTTPPSFGTLFNQRMPISGVVTDNTCAGAEAVAFEGWGHVLTTGQLTPTVDVKGHINAVAEGIGLISGDRYILIQNNKGEFVTSAGGTTIDQEVDIRFRMIREGSDDNFWLRLTFRLTFPPGTMEFIRDEVECRG